MEGEHEKKVEAVEEKTVVPPPACEDKPGESKATAVVEKKDEIKDDKSAGGLSERDAALAKVEAEKRLLLVRAWEDNEKTKAENKWDSLHMPLLYFLLAIKELSAICSWENTKKAFLEAKLKKIKEDLEKQKAAYAEKIKNKMATVHKQAEEKKVIAEAKRSEELLKAEELAAKYRVTGLCTKNIISCFGN